MSGAFCRTLIAILLLLGAFAGWLALRPPLRELAGVAFVLGSLAAWLLVSDGYCRP